MSRRALLLAAALWAIATGAALWHVDGRLRALEHERAVTRCALVVFEDLSVRTAEQVEMGACIERAGIRLAFEGRRP